MYDENGVEVDHFRPEYWHTDHLGNVRLAFSDVNNNGRIEIEDDPGTQEDDTEIMQENHYYPFGMNQLGPWYETVAPENKYQYNGKELNEELGLDWYDYGARWHDAAVGRWGAIDPKAESYFSISSRSYAINNPIVYIDPNGAETITYYGVDAQNYFRLLQMTMQNESFEPNRNQATTVDGLFEYIEKSTDGTLSGVYRHLKFSLTKFQDIYTQREKVGLTLTMSLLYLFKAWARLIYLSLYQVTKK
jgi:RHS repeat-associated protein